MKQSIKKNKRENKRSKRNLMNKFKKLKKNLNRNIPREIILQRNKRKMKPKSNKRMPTNNWKLTSFHLRNLEPQKKIPLYKLDLNRTSSQNCNQIQRVMKVF